MGRPRSVSDDELLDAAATVLRRSGPAFTLQQVGEAAGLSAAGLVQRFGSKRGLLLAFAEREARRASEPFTAAAAERSPLKAARRVLRELARAMGDRGELAASLALLLEDVRDEALRAAAAEHARRFEEGLRQLLQRAVEAGELRGDPRALARTVQATWNGALIQWALRGTGRVEDWVDRAIDPLLA